LLTAIKVVIRKTMRKLLPLAICIVPFSFLLAEESFSNAELSRKLNLLLGRVNSLEKRVSNLEGENLVVKKEIKEVAKSANETLSLPEDQKEKSSFLENLRNQLRSDEAKSQGPWTRETTWKSMQRNLTAFQVRKILGNPNKIKKSTNPRIDQVYLYTGDLDADGQEEVGEVNLLRDRVQSFRSPF
jgi:ParB-like chromosome segregation protein Spo0J